MKNLMMYFVLSFLILSCSNSKKNVISKDTSAIEEKTVAAIVPEIINKTEIIEDEVSDVKNTIAEEKAEKEITAKKKVPIVTKTEAKVSNKNIGEFKTSVEKETIPLKIKIEEVITNNSKPTIKEAVVKEMEPIKKEVQKSIDESIRTFVDKERGITGNWSLKQEGENVYVVFHSNFKTKSGPDLKVFISKQDISTSNGKNAEKNAVLLKDLSSNKGEQKYLIPPNIDLSQYKSFLIHCKKYAKLWGGGKL